MISTWSPSNKVVWESIRYLDPEPDQFNRVSAVFSNSLIFEVPGKTRFGTRIREWLLRLAP